MSRNRRRERVFVVICPDTVSSLDSFDLKFQEALFFIFQETGILWEFYFMQFFFTAPLQLFWFKRFFFFFCTENLNVFHCPSLLHTQFFWINFLKACHFLKQFASVDICWFYYIQYLQIEQKYQVENMMRKSDPSL